MRSEEGSRGYSKMADLFEALLNLDDLGMRHVPKEEDQM